MIFEELVKKISDLSEGETSYASSKISKDGMAVSSFKNNTSFYSLYKPLIDAENFCKSAEFNDAGFIITGGLGNGYHIHKLSVIHPECFFLVVEDSYASFKTLIEQNDFSCFIHKNNIHFCVINDLSNTIINLYKPALHGSIMYKSIRSWVSYHISLSSIITEQISSSIKVISADFSVQSHFGKIWMRNIRTNIALLESNFEYFTDIKLCTIPNHKPAAIIAAGPSLDVSIELLKQNPEQFFIIAVDTALEILSKHSIKADAFVTIDGQNISSRLFTNIKKPYPSLAVIDCCAHPNALRFSSKHQIPILLCSTGHPLSCWFQKHSCIISLMSGSGTVTITALDFAVQAGFTSIVFFGADFSYPEGKPYANGTYLETFFLESAKRYCPIEMHHTALMFRTEVRKEFESTKMNAKKCTYTAPILDSYKTSLLDYIRSLNKPINFYTSVKGNLPFPIYRSNNCTISAQTSLRFKPLQNIAAYFPEYAALVHEELEEVFITLLPYYAWFLKHMNLKPSKSSIISFKTLVKKQFDNYTDNYHES